MNTQLKVAELQGITEISAEVIFDRHRFAKSTMNDKALQTEVLTLFIDQLAKIDGADWQKLDLSFEMHAIRGSAAAIGAVQIEMICSRWVEFGPFLEMQLKQAIAAFCIEATRS